MLIVEDLVKRYVNEVGELKGGVADVCFEVAEGELFTLLGPSGCGKTTTLRSIAGLETPGSGRIALDGRDLFNGGDNINVPMHDRDIGMVFQSYAIWPHMNVFENAAYPLRVRRRKGMTRADLEERVVRALEMVGLAEFRRRSATKLSGGQQQRLALARALVREPKLLLLDEPLSNLDALLREQMRNEIKRLQTEWGVTTIYVTHDQSEAMALSDRIAVLNDSKVIQIGTPADIYDRPRSEFVANFIGRTNLLRGAATSGGQAGQLAQIDLGFGSLMGSCETDIEPGQQTTFVIRPENIELRADTGDKEPCQNTVQGHVRNRLFLGEIAEYVVNLKGDQEILVRAHPSLQLEQGQAVQVVMPPERIVAIS